MNLLKECLDIDMISDVTGLTIKEITQISKV